MGQYNRHAVVPLANVFAAMKAGGTKHTYESHTFNISSLRLRTFKRDAGHLVCAGCGVKASFFAVESFNRNSEIKSVHINLYGLKESGEEVLFTHDHILARSLGGKDSIENAQTMCGPCNWRKGALEAHQVNQVRYMTTLSPKAKEKHLRVMEKQKNPTPPSELEKLFGFWASSKDLESFTRKVDSWLYKHGWNRKRLKQEINNGTVNFTLFPVRD